MRSLKHKSNVQAPSSDFPYGRIKDDDGSGNGTPVNENVYGDFHQFFERLMVEAGIVPNEMPEAEYEGFQLINALKFLIRTKRKIIDIGPWNMNSTGNIFVTHGLLASKIRRVSVIIHNDLSSEYYDLVGYTDFANNHGGGIGTIDSQVELKSINGGLFQTNTAFDDGTQNRGTMIIEYEE